MYRVIFLSLCLAVIVAGLSKKMQICAPLLHGGIACCEKGNMDNQPPPTEELEQCIEKKPPSCEFETCMGQKMGFVSSNGTVNKWAFLAHLKKHMRSDPDLIDQIADKCVHGDLYKYAVDNLCDIMKLKLCTQIQFLKNCNSWNEDNRCKRMQKLASVCTRQFD